MDIIQFLDTVLPSQGARCLGVIQRGMFSNSFGGTNEWAANGVKRMTALGVDVYFGCSSFGADKRRTQDNVAFVRSFWIDIDTQESKPKETYANRKVAVTELTRFCEEIGLPQPMLVSSGYGLHCYWPCQEDMDSATWKETATLLKQACKVWGLAADPTRTADEASVLRPIGSSNFKNGKERPVKLLRTCQPVDRNAFHARLHVYLKQEDQLPSAPAHVAASQNINSDLMVQKEYKPSSAHRIAKHCAVIHHMRETKGDVDQPTWYGGIGVLAFTEEGDSVCHEWSSGHDDYSASQTDAKIVQARRYAPTTCERLSEFQPALCGSCPHMGKIKSPIALGVEDREPQYIPDETGEVPDLPHMFVPAMPDGFGWGEIETAKEPMLYREVYKKSDDPEATSDWVMERQPFADILFYPTTRISEQLGAKDKSYKMSITINRKQGGQVDFVVDNGVVAAGGSELVTEMGRREIMVDNNVSLQLYLKAWARRLRDEYNEVRQISQFGWVDDSFALGELMITPKGHTKTLLCKNAPKAAKPLHSQGDLALWKHAIDKLLNVPGLEAQQFCFLSSLAAPLYHMIEKAGGIVVYAGTSDSSYGKSTACKAGLTIWGNGMSGMVMGRFTTNGLYEHLGVRCNLPVVIDEMTNCENRFASDLVYEVSNGEGKVRLNADSIIKETAEWSTIVIGNGNNLLSEKIAANRPNAQGELVRLWEFIPTNKPDMDPNEFLKLETMLKENFGLVGPVFAEYLVKNYDAVKARIDAKLQEVNHTFKMQSQERFWAKLFALVLVALDLGRELEFIDFDVKNMRQWIETELSKSRGVITQSTADPLEQFGRMLTDLQAGILVTEGRGMLSKGESARCLAEPRGNSPLVGRYIYPTDRNTKEVLILSVAAARDWATKHGTPLRDIIGALASQGVLVDKPSRMKLGQGVAKYAGSSPSVSCWELDALRLNDILGDSPLATKLSVVGATQGPAKIPAANPSSDENDIDSLISN